LTPIDLEPAGVSTPLEHPVYVADVSGGSNIVNKPLRHRPHAFALTHGDRGARIAYGELHIRVDSIKFDFKPWTKSGEDDVVRCASTGRKDIEKLTPIIPTIGSSGDPLDPDIPNIYHQLDGYGNIYLNWSVNLASFTEGSPEDVVTSCYVSSSQTGTEVAALDAGDDDSGLGEGGRTGDYSIKIGEVREGELIKQHVSSDVFWSFFVVGREKLTNGTQSNMTC